MSKLEETLENFSKKFCGENIIIKFDNIIKGKIIFGKTDIKYNRNDGFLEINEKENHMMINIVDINYMDYTDSKLDIILDNEFKIEIIKNNQ